MANKYTGSDTGKGGLEVKKTTGTPDVRGVTEIQLDTNLTLTDNGNGGVTIQSSGGGSGVTSVGLTETGSALTITNSPITTSGNINIAGAGNSSQVILGDLTLGTLPTPANPSATIGASANNGTATTTFMRSDASPALETTGVTAATYGSSTTVGQFSVDATGRITSAANVSISGGVTSVATSAPLTGGTITGTGTIGIAQASGSADGYLSSANWNTFNNKLAAGANVSTLNNDAGYINEQQIGVFSPPTAPPVAVPVALPDSPTGGPLTPSGWLQINLGIGAMYMPIYG